MPSATFRPHEHIRNPLDFQRAFDRKRSASDPNLVIHGAENSLGYSRLGISVGKRKVRRATDRNHLKRLIREAFRLNKAVLPVGVDLVVVPRNLKLSFADANHSLPTLALAVGKRLAIKPSTPPKPEPTPEPEAIP